MSIKGNVSKIQFSNIVNNCYHRFMKEITKYKNELNTVSMRTWKPEEMDFFFAIIAKAKDQGTKLLRFSKEELSALVKPDSHQARVRKTLERLADHITGLKYYERTEKRYSVMLLFQCFEIIWDDDGNYTAEVQVSEKFEYILNRIKDNFTQFPLEEFVQIRSTYAKTLYRLLKQYKQAGKLYLSQEEFKERLAIPDSYRQTHINNRVLATCQDELKGAFENLKIEKQYYLRKGNPVKGYLITWKPEKVQKWIDPDSYRQKKRKEEAVKRKSQLNLPDWYSVIPDEPATAEDLEAVRRLQEEILGKGKQENE